MWCHSKKSCLYSVQFCSVTEIYFWHIRAYLVNVFRKRRRLNRIEGKCKQTFFREIHFVHICKCSTALGVMWNAGITLHLWAAADAVVVVAFAELWFIVRRSLIALFVLLFRRMHTYPWRQKQQDFHPDWACVLRVCLCLFARVWMLFYIFKEFQFVFSERRNSDL